MVKKKNKDEDDKGESQEQQNARRIYNKKNFFKGSSLKV